MDQQEKIPAWQQAAQMVRQLATMVFNDMKAQGETTEAEVLLSHWYNLRQTADFFERFHTTELSAPSRESMRAALDRFHAMQHRTAQHGPERCECETAHVVMQLALCMAQDAIEREAAAHA